MTCRQEVLLLFVAFVVLTNAKQLPHSEEEEATNFRFSKKTKSMKLPYSEEDESTKLPYSEEDESTKLPYSEEDESTKLPYRKVEAKRLAYAEEEKTATLPYTKQEIDQVVENFEQLFAAYSARNAPLVFSKIVVPIADFLESKMSASKFKRDHSERLINLFAELPESDFFLRRVTHLNTTRAFLDVFVESKKKCLRLAECNQWNATSEIENLKQHPKWVIIRLWRNVLLSLSARRILRCPILNDLATVQLPALRSGVVLDEKAKKKIVTVLSVVPCDYSLVKVVENEAAIRAVIDIVEQYGHQWKDHLPQ